MRIKLTHIYEWLINVMNIQRKKILMSDKIDSQRILTSRGYHTRKLYCTYRQTNRQRDFLLTFLHIQRVLQSLHLL